MTLLALLALTTTYTWFVLAHSTLFKGPRARFYARFPPYPPSARWPGRLLVCPWCAGFWLSGLLVLVVAQFVSLPLPLLWWTGVAGAAGLVGGMVE